MIANILSSDLVCRLGWTILHSFWQILLVGGIAGLLLAMATRGSATLRYWIATGALAFAYVPLVLTFCLVAGQPAPHAEVPSALAVQRQASKLPASVESSNTLAIPSTEEASAQPSVGVSGRTPATMGEPAPQVAHATPRGNVRAVRAALNSWLPWVVGIWCAGVVLQAIWNVGGWIMVQRIRASATTAVSEHVRERMEILAQRLEIRRTVKIATSLLVDVPIVMGWLRPIILLPVSLVSGVSPAQLDAILLHELAHIRRHDYLVNQFQLLTETLLFFHPVVWLVSRRIRIEREFCCDDSAIAAGTDRATFVRALAAVEGSRVASPYVLSMAGGSSALSLRRARRIVTRTAPAPPHAGITGLCGLAVLVASLWIVVFGGGVTATGETPAFEVADAEYDRQLHDSHVARTAAPATAAPDVPIDVQRFRVSIQYYGNADKPFYHALFSTEPLQAREDPFRIVEQLDEQGQQPRAGQLVRWLTASGFFEHAVPGAVQGTGEQGYLLQVASGDKVWTEDLGWGLGMLLRLDSLRAAFVRQPESSRVDVQTPAPIDPLIGRMNGLRREWTGSRELNGLEDRISTTAASFAAGGSIPIRLEIKNTSGQDREFSSHYVSLRDTPHNYLFQFDIYDRFGRKVPYLGGLSQFRVEPATLGPGESDHFTFDLARSHYLARPGSYTVIHRDGGLRQSNALEFQVTPSEVDAGDPVGKLLPLIPAEWILVADPLLETKLRPGANFEPVTGRPIRFEYRPRHGNIRDVRLIFLWLTNEQAEEAPPGRPSAPSAGPASRYEGQVNRWHLYIHEGEQTLQLWPTVLDDVKQALQPEENVVDPLDGP